MSRFDPVFYRAYRPFYPAETFAGLADELQASGVKPPFRVADIGCGTGHSMLSLLRTQIPARVTGIDPDPRMLDAARELFAGEKLEAEFRLGSGENTGLASASLDAIIVGSAFHWMDPAGAVAEFHRVLAPTGLVRLFEYQFPKLIEEPELNEWIRRQFNLRWKAPGQKPRGSFRELTATFKAGGGFTFVAERSPRMVHTLGAEDLAGLIFSQSRVLHYENSLSESGLARFRQEVRDFVQTSLREGRTVEADFRLSWIQFAPTL